MRKRTAIIGLFCCGAFIGLFCCVAVWVVAAAVAIRAQGPTPVPQTLTPTGNLVFSGKMLNYQGVNDILFGPASPDFYKRVCVQMKDQPKKCVTTADLLLYLDAHGTEDAK